MMCNSVDLRADPKNKATDAAKQLSKIFEEELEVSISPLAFKYLLKLRWDRISTLAHIIHEGA